jgi:hypothetical protein
MPQFGNPHGLVRVHYDEDWKTRVIKDRECRHNGVDSRQGLVLQY